MVVSTTFFSMTNIRISRAELRAETILAMEPISLTPLTRESINALVSSLPALPARLCFRSEAAQRQERRARRMRVLVMMLLGAVLLVNW